MIHYDKLKLAFDLAEKLSKTAENMIKISCNFYKNGMDFDVSENGVSMVFIELDTLIDYLPKLTQPKPKFVVARKYGLSVMINQ